MTPPPPRDPALADLILATAERRLTAAEVAADLAAPITVDESSRVLALVEWFCRRYPTAHERLAYVRRAYRRWTRTVSPGAGRNVRPR